MCREVAGSEPTAAVTDGSGIQRQVYGSFFDSIERTSLSIEGGAACCSALALLARLQAEKRFFRGTRPRKNHPILFAPAGANSARLEQRDDDVSSVVQKMAAADL